MIPIILLKGVEPPALGKALGSDRTGALSLLPHLDPGDILSARIEAKLPDGSYKALVGGQPLRMVLPSHISPGDTLELTFVAREPRLTFVLNDAQQAAPEPVLSAAGRQVAATTAQPGEPATPATTAANSSLLASGERLSGQYAQALVEDAAPVPVLSAAGRLVAATMLQPGELSLPLKAAANVPLLVSPPANGGRLSGQLAQTLAESGLFYESHQAEWVAGRRELAQIRQEPQARLTPGAPLREARTAPALVRELPAAAQSQLRDQTIDPRSVPLVQQQLAVIDTARVVLQLEIWPRQWLQWEIEEQQPGPEREPEATQSWNTQLRLKLPRLGDLKAALNLGGDGVRVRLEAESAASAALLHEHRSALQAALADAGIAPTGITIAYHEQP